MGALRAEVDSFLREGFEAGSLQVSKPETNEFDNAREAYTKLSKKKSRAKHVLAFG
jgi:hypothetical protein